MKLSNGNNKVKTYVYEKPFFKRVFLVRAHVSPILDIFGRGASSIIFFSNLSQPYSPSSNKMMMIIKTLEGADK